MPPLQPLVLLPQNWPQAAKPVSEAVKPAGDGGSNTAKFTAKWFLAMAAGLLGAFYHGVGKTRSSSHLGRHGVRHSRDQRHA